MSQSTRVRDIVAGPNIHQAALVTDHPPCLQPTNFTITKDMGPRIDCGHQPLRSGGLRRHVRLLASTWGTDFTRDDRVRSGKDGRWGVKLDPNPEKQHRKYRQTYRPSHQEVAGLDRGL